LDCELRVEWELCRGDELAVGYVRAGRRLIAIPWRAWVAFAVCGAWGVCCIVLSGMVAISAALSEAPQRYGEILMCTGT